MERNFIPRKPTGQEELLKAEVRKMMVRDRCRLLERQPFIGHLAMRLDLKPVIDCRMNTACTDGTRLFADAEFYRKMDEEERLGVLGHEVWHCALRHFNRRGERDKRKFNYACDVETDLLLYNAGFKVEILPCDKNWLGMSAEQIYDRMIPAMANFQKEDLHLYSEDQRRERFPQPQQGSASDEQEETQKKNGQDDSSEDCGNRTQTGDDGTQTGGDGEQSTSDSGKTQSGQSGGSGTQTPGIRTTLPRVTHDTVFDPDFDPAFGEETTEEWKENLKEAVRREKEKGEKGIGNIPGNVEELIREDEKKATVDWKKVLLDFVTQIFGGERRWLPPARRYVWKKLYLPSRARKKTIEIVLAVDTSGSTTADLPDFLAELRGMAGSFGEYKLTIIQCDRTIHSVKEYSNDDPLPEEGLKFQGFGGTTLCPPFAYVEKEMPEPPAVFIYLTDGYGDAPSKAPAYPVIWCITRDGIKPTSWGLNVKIGAE